MPEKETLERARKDKKRGKAPSTQAGEFVREEIHHVREGKHGARSTKQAIAIGLSKARRAGVRLPPPEKGRATEATRENAERSYEAGQKPRHSVSRKRSRATSDALKREPRSAATTKSLSKQAKSAAGKRSASSRSEAGRKAARTKGPAKRSAAAKKGARTKSRTRA